jgi:hypothetical protein
VPGEPGPKRAVLPGPGRAGRPVWTSLFPSISLKLKSEREFLKNKTQGSMGKSTPPIEPTAAIAIGFSSTHTGGADLSCKKKKSNKNVWKITCTVPGLVRTFRAPDHLALISSSSVCPAYSSSSRERERDSHVGLFQGIRKKSERRISPRRPVPVQVQGRSQNSEVQMQLEAGAGQVWVAQS